MNNLATVSPPTSKIDVDAQRVLDLLQKMTLPAVGSQFSVLGAAGIPSTGFNLYPPDRLVAIEETLETQLLGSSDRGVNLIFRDGFTFEFLSSQEASLFRHDRGKNAHVPKSEVLGEIQRNALLRTAVANCVVLNGLGSQSCSAKIASVLGAQHTPVIHMKFANFESYVEIPESIRGKHVMIMQSFVGDIDIALASTKLLLDAVSRASAKTITLVSPYLPYARQDRRGAERTSVSPAALFSSLDAAARGALSRVITVDLHSLQVEGMSGKINVDNLSGAALFLPALREYLGKTAFAVVFPDAGARKRANEDRLDEKLATYFERAPRIGTMAKSRSDEKNKVASSVFEGDPEIIHGKTVVLFDDMIDTGGTILESAKVLKQLGAAKVIICATHPIFSRNAAERFRSATVEVDGIATKVVDKIFVTDSIPLRCGKGDLIEVISIYNMLGLFIAGVLADGVISTRELADHFLKPLAK